VYLKHAVAEI